MLSRNESLTPLPDHLRQPLAALIAAYDQGAGPVEREARARRGAGAPMSAVEILTFAEGCYPAEVRSFLDARGYQALFRGDLERALAASAAGAGHGRPAGREAGWIGGLRLAVLAMAVGMSGFILIVALPKVQRAPASPGPVPTVVAAPPPVRTAAESLCREGLRDDAAAWCESALTGTRARDPLAGATSGACGDPLTTNSDTVRLALNGLLDEGVTGTYGSTEARERCAAAAELSVPR